jgi:hypothetical protein
MKNKYFLTNTGGGIYTRDTTQNFNGMLYGKRGGLLLC